MQLENITAYDRNVKLYYPIIFQVHIFFLHIVARDMYIICPPIQSNREIKESQSHRLRVSRVLY